VKEVDHCYRGGIGGKGIKIRERHGLEGKVQLALIQENIDIGNQL